MILTGIALKNDAATALVQARAVKPALSDFTAGAPPTFAKDGDVTGAYTYTTNSGMALTSGETTASNSTVQVFTLDRVAGTFGITVTHNATLKSAITTSAIAVEQMTCVDIFTSAP